RISKLAREVETTLRQKPLDVAELRENMEALAQESKEPTLNTASEEPAAPVSPSAGSGVRVLILDADPNLRALAKAFVESQAMECRTAGDGRSALDAVEAFRPHIVVLDLNLPGMGGHEVLAKLRASETPVKVLLLTADEHPDTRNADDFLVKPFHPGELIVRVRKLAGVNARPRGGSAAP